MGGQGYTHFQLTRDTMKPLLPLLLASSLPLLSLAYVTGGTAPYSTTLDDDNVKFAVKAINDFFKTHRTATSLVSASRQVVAGYMYRYVIEVQEGIQKSECKVSVWVRDWMDPPQQVYGDPECTDKPVSCMVAKIIGCV